jgi:hypothetical protein
MRRLSNATLLVQCKDSIDGIDDFVVLFPIRFAPEFNLGDGGPCDDEPISFFVGHSVWSRRGGCTFAWSGR